MKERYPRATFTQQAGLVAARVAAEKGQYDAATREPGLGRRQGGRERVPVGRAPAPGRPAARHQEVRRGAEAARRHRRRAEFAALAADRRGDILLAEGKSAEAKAAYLKAWTAMDPKVDYRRLVEAKLNLLGVQPAAGAASGVEAAK